MFLHMPLQALCVEKGAYACTACNLLGRLQLFDPFPFPPVRFTTGMSGSLKLNDVHNRIPYVRGGILLQHGEFGIPPQGLQEVTLNPTGEGYLSD